MSLVTGTLISTDKNQPARDFLDGVAGAYRQASNGGWRFEIPTEVAATAVYNPGRPETVEATVLSAPPPPTDRRDYRGVAQGKSLPFERIATELASPQQVLDAIRRELARPRHRPDLGRSLSAPRTEVETELALIWAELLRIDSVGIEDNYFELGGTSLLAVDLFALIEHRFGRKLPLGTLITAPTISQLAGRVAGTAVGDSLVLIRDGAGQPPLFLVHDGDGDTLLYLNLAMHLKAERAVYGLQPCSRGNAPMIHTRIPEMAAYHIDKCDPSSHEVPISSGGCAPVA